MFKKLKARFKKKENKESKPPRITSHMGVYAVVSLGAFLYIVLAFDIIQGLMIMFAAIYLSVKTLEKLNVIPKRRNFE